MDNIAIEIIKTLKTVMDLLKENVHEEYKSMNLTGPQGMVIGHLAHNGETRIGELSKEMGLSNSTVSGIIDRLEKQGLVERVRSEEDRRVVKIKLNDKFKKKAKSKFKIVEQKLSKIINKSSQEDLDSILNGLENLKKILEEEVESKE